MSVSACVYIHTYIHAYMQVTAHNIFKSLSVLSEFFIFLYIGMGFVIGTFLTFQPVFFILCTLFCMVPLCMYVWLCMGVCSICIMYVYCFLRMFTCTCIHTYIHTLLYQEHANRYSVLYYCLLGFKAVQHLPAVFPGEPDAQESDPAAHAERYVVCRPSRSDFIRSGNTPHTYTYIHT